MDNYSRTNLPLALWRLLITPPATGPWNMAVDEAILRSISEGYSPATLRLFAWEPPCLSLGYAQHIEDADLNALEEKHWDIVRRPTGGRAILHTDELTYSVIAPPSEPRLSGGVLESYQRIAKALMHALHVLDVPAQSSAVKEISTNGEASDPVCFDVPSNYEITVSGKKLVGSAQARKREGVLQHGTLPLHGDLTRITQVLNYPTVLEREKAASKLLERATTVEQILRHKISWETASSAFTEAFQSVLNINLQPRELSQIELEYVNELQNNKYGHPAWTNRV